MNEEYPVKERIYVLEDDESLGPFEIDEILEHLESGRFDYGAVCLREGALETERLRDVLDWADEGEKRSRNAERQDPEPFQPEEPAAENKPSKEAEDEPVLAPSEILYRGNRSVLTYPFSMIGLVGGAVGAVWLFAIDQNYAVVCICIFLLALGYLTLMRFTCEYFVTPRRVELEKGLIAKSSNEVRIVDIRAINVTCTGFTGILGIGTVDFFTAGDDPEVTFRDVWAAKKVKKLVRRLQDEGV